MGNKKTRAKNYYQTNKEKLQKGSRKYCRSLFEYGEMRKRNYANTRNKNMSDADRERKKNI